MCVYLYNSSYIHVTFIQILTTTEKLLMATIKLKLLMSTFFGNILYENCRNLKIHKYYKLDFLGASTGPTIKKISNCATFLKLQYK